MKKLVSCLLVVVMLFTFAGAFAEPANELESFAQFDILTRFLKETDLKTQDIALQVESGDKAADLVIRVDRNNLHMVSRNNGVEDSHVQLNPTGIYTKANGNVSLLRYATVTSFMQKIADAVDKVLEEAVKSVPEEQMPTKAEIRKAVKEISIIAAAAQEQEQADAATLSAAAMSFASKFKPENILDVKQDDGSATISLRSDAYASALAEAVDEMMSNPALAELVNRKASKKGGDVFAALQAKWLENREATLEAIRTIESTDTIDEDGHWVSHYQIGEETEETKILVCDSDAWIDAESGNAQIVVGLGVKDEDPILVYELTEDEYSYREKVSADDCMTQVRLDYDEGLVNYGEVVCVIEGNEWMRMEIGPDYFYMKGPKGGISTSVRETWTGKIRYELVAETSEGQQTSVIFDYYQDGDSLVCEMNTSESEQPVFLKFSRIDKVDIEDLSASENVNEINMEIEGDLEDLVKTILTEGTK